MSKMICMKHYLLLLFLVCSRFIYGQDTTQYERYKFALEELQLDSTENLVSIATQTTLRLRDAPSVVSVIHREDVQAMGARDLLDILRHIQGFDFGIDVNGVIGMGMRGNWAHEGKVLLMIDGQELNELMYASTQLGNHYSPDMIERIEIIRGAGSAIYGGFAEYGVINIVTRGSQNLNGLQVSNTFGVTSNQDGKPRQNFNMALGRSSVNWKVWGSIFKGSAMRSDRVFSDAKSVVVDMASNYVIETFSTNIGLQYKNLDIRALYDNYINNTHSNFAYVAPTAFQRTFRTALIDIKYRGKINSKLTITPRLSYTYFRPWFFEGKDSLASDFNNNERVARLRSAVFANYTPTTHLNLTAGGELYADHAAYTDGFYTGSNTIDFTNTALYAQLLWKTSFFNVTAGARYDNHSFYPSTFVPRLGITHAWEKLHIKLLYSNAFRSPTVQNINFGITQDIRPERTTVVEFETGYIFSPNFSTTLNFYDITTNDPIIYFVADDETEGYINQRQTGTRGAELEFRYKTKKGFIETTYSFYTTQGKRNIASFAIPDNENQLLGLAPHKLSIWTNYKIYQKLYLSASMIWLSARFAYNKENDEGIQTITRYQPNTLLNFSLRYQSLFREGISVSVGVRDALNQAPPFMQAYNGGHAPLPNLSREWIFRINYDLDW